MRPVLLFSFTLATAGACRTAPQGIVQAPVQLPQRDLTLEPVGVPSIEVASPIELARTPAGHRRVRRAGAPRRSVPASRAENAPPPAHAVPAPTPVRVAAAVAVPSPAPEVSDPHALAPGQTVTLVPVSTATSSGEPSSGEPSGTGAAWTDARRPPVQVGGGVRGGGVRGGGNGGGCRGGRGRHGFR